MRGSYIDPREGKITLKTYAEERLAALPEGNCAPTAPAYRLAMWRPTSCPARQPPARRGAPPRLHRVRRRAHREAARPLHLGAHRLCGAAVADAKRGAGPADPGEPARSRAPLPRLDKRVLARPWPRKAVTALAAAMPRSTNSPAWLAAGAGLREGEALGLTVPRVEFLARGGWPSSSRCRTGCCHR